MTQYPDYVGRRHHPNGRRLPNRDLRHRFRDAPWPPTSFIGEEFQNARRHHTLSGRPQHRAGKSRKTGRPLPGPPEARPCRIPTPLSSTAPASSTFWALRLVATGNNSPTDQPRNTYRYDVSLKGFGSSAPDTSPATASISSPAPQAPTSHEGRSRPTTFAMTPTPCPSSWYFLIGSDTNTQSSAQTPYQTLVGSAVQQQRAILRPHQNSGQLEQQSRPSNSSIPKTPQRVRLAWTTGTTRFCFPPISIDGARDWTTMAMPPFPTARRPGTTRTIPTAPGEMTAPVINMSLTITGKRYGGRDDCSIAGQSSALNGGHLPVFPRPESPGQRRRRFPARSRWKACMRVRASADRHVPVLHPLDNSGDITRTAPINGDREPITLSGLPLKNYTVHIKGAKWLAKNVTRGRFEQAM